jgi:hypothetical protein
LRVRIFVCAVHISPAIRIVPLTEGRKKCQHQSEGTERTVDKMVCHWESALLFMVRARSVLCERSVCRQGKNSLTHGSSLSLSASLLQKLSEPHCATYANLRVLKKLCLGVSYWLWKTVSIPRQPGNRCPGHPVCVLIWTHMRLCSFWMNTWWNQSHVH